MQLYPSIAMSCDYGTHIYGNWLHKYVHIIIYIRTYIYVRIYIYIYHTVGYCIVRIDMKS